MEPRYGERRWSRGDYIKCDLLSISPANVFRHLRYAKKACLRLKTKDLLKRKCLADLYILIRVPKHI